VYVTTILTRKESVAVLRISAKARYAMAAVTQMARRGTDKSITVLELSKALQISKIYLEQIFALLKRGGIVSAVKGARGGYFLARAAKDITAFDVLSVIETALFEPTEPTLRDGNEEMEAAMQPVVVSQIDEQLQLVLAGVSLAEIANKAEALAVTQGNMYYI